MITAEFEKERKRMKEELKKSLRTYGALLLLGVTGVPLGAAVGLIEALFCRLLLKVTAVRVAHLFWCLPFLAMAGLVIVAVNQKFGGRGKGGMSLIFDVAYEEETELPLRMIPLAMLSTALTHLFGGSAGREGVAVQIGAVFSYFAGKKLPFKNAPGIFLVTGMAAGFAGMFGTPIAAVIFAVEVLAAGEMRYEALLPAFTASFSASAVASLLGIRKENLAVHISESLTPFLLVRLITLGIIFGITGGLFAWCLKHTKKYLGEKIKNPLVRVFSIGVILSILFLLLYRGRYCGGNVLPVQDCTRFQ
jgi:H+/Cl- antiporter ClcA